MNERIKRDTGRRNQLHHSCLPVQSASERVGAQNTRARSKTAFDAVATHKGLIETIFMIKN